MNRVSGAHVNSVVGTGTESSNVAGIWPGECRICGQPGGHPRYVAREMMFGSREKFEYFECSRCGCLQIAEIPADLGAYYRTDYLSFAEPPRISNLRRCAERARARSAFGHPDPVGALLLRAFGAAVYTDWVRNAGGNLETAILDVGCGAGHLLRQMRDAGFTSLVGIDPFLPTDLTIPAGLDLRRCDLSECTGTYGLVMLHHSFEHMPDPAAALGDVRRLLGRGGVAVIRIPVAGCHAWRTYATDWVQLDAPRHLHLHTPTSMRHLAERVGLELLRMDFDSTGFQFWGSEQYRRGIPLFDADSPREAIFSPAQIRAYDERARELNREGDGDSACFYLRRSD